MFYLHIGSGRMVPLREVIAVLNAERPLPPDTADVRDKAEAEKKLTPAANDNAVKSLVICENQIYESPISSGTLCKRAMDYIWEEKNESTGK